MNIYKFGDLKDKGYEGSLNLLFPIFKFEKEKYLDGREFSTKLISFPNKICFTNNSYCVKIEVCVLGFGLKFEMFERSK